MSSKKPIKGRLAISHVDKNRYFSISVKLLPTREIFPMTKVSNDMKIKEMKALAEFATGIPYHMQILRYLDEGKYIISASAEYLSWRCVASQEILEGRLILLWRVTLKKCEESNI